jgi:hypothetical protein
LFKRERLFSGNKTRGATPRGEWPFSIDVKGGELITLMLDHVVIDAHGFVIDANGLID